MSVYVIATQGRDGPELHSINDWQQGVIFWRFYSAEELRNWRSERKQRGLT